MFKKHFKTSLITTCILGSSALYAGTMGPVCTPGNVTTPCENQAWSFAGEALYLEANYPGNNFNGLKLNPGNNLVFSKFNDNWGWGFFLEAGYHFSTGNDIDVNWYYYNHTTSRTYNVATGQRFLIDASALSLPGSPGPFNFTRSRKTQWDAVNFEMGQLVNFGERSVFRFHGGAQYAYINTHGTLVTPVTALTSYSSNTTYNGGGPRIGADLSYKISAVNLYAKGAAAILVGQNQYKNNLVNPLIGAATVYASNTTIVPELEGKLGVNYLYPLAQGDLGLDLGWMWNNYFNASLTTSNQLDMRNSNFAIQGLYFGLKWTGNFV